jgi:iron complex outermembrane recepter protein
MSINGRNLLVCSTSAALLCTGAVGAQNDDAPIVEEVVVTAQKRTERAQDVPITVSVIDPARLEAAQLKRSDDLPALVPGLFPVAGSGPRNFFLRGVGISTSTPGQDPPVPTYVDDVYVASPVASTLLINNAERIEVLKGPQGTLFGRNAVAGMIAYHTKNPGDAPGVIAELGYGNYDTSSARLYATSPLTENLAANLAVAHEEQADGFGYNSTTQKDFRRLRNTAVRAKFLWTPTSETRVLLTGWHDDNWTEQNASTSNPGEPSATGFTNLGGPYDFLGNWPSFTRNHGGGGSLRVDHDLGWASIVNIAAYQRVSPEVSVDLDGGPTDAQRFVQSWTQETWTEELQLISSGDGPLSWTAGLFFLSDEVPAFNQAVGGVLVPAGSRVVSRLKTTAWAPFVQATLRLQETTNLTAGFRYSSEKKEYSGRAGNNANGALIVEDTSADYHSPTYRLALDHHFSPQLMGYVSYNRGFKSGTYNMQVVSNPPRPLEPETLNAYEIGLKSTLFDRRATLNLAGFYYDYSNITVRAPVNNATAFDLQNAATARIYGINLDAFFQASSDLSIFGGLEALSARYRDFPSTTGVRFLGNGVFQPYVFDASDKRVPWAPTLTGNLGAGYTYGLPSGGSLLFSGNVNFRSRLYYEVDNVRSGPPLGLVNGSITWTASDGRVDVSLWGRNLADERYRATRTSTALTDFVLYGDPRTYGVTVSARFGNL